MRVLWLSLCAPYDLVAHGGGQNHNYYLKYMKKALSDNITLLTLYEPNEKDKLDFYEYGIDAITREYDKNKICISIQNILGKFLVYRHGGLLENKAYHLFLDEIDEFASRNTAPDIVIMQWTETVLLIDKVKKFFPKAKYIAIEEDVAFLGYERKYKNSIISLKLYKWLKYYYLKKRELEALEKCDLVVALNEKDKRALVENSIGTEKIYQSCSYHGLYSKCTYNPDVWSLMFYGAMSRKENYEGAIWFIENVMPLLDEKYRLYVVGAKPIERLLQLQNDRVVVTGFVEDVSVFFENCLCMVAPLHLGAGIKIKVLEALSAGIPVITNEIGSEGIQIVEGKNYLKADSPKEYADAIELLHENYELRQQISSAGKRHIEEYFDVQKKLDKLIDVINRWENRE